MPEINDSPSYRIHAGFRSMELAGEEETKSHRSIKSLYLAQIVHFEDAQNHFECASAMLPTADMQWAIATEMRLMAIKYRELLSNK